MLFFNLKFNNFVTDDELGILPAQNEIYDPSPIENNRNRSNSFDLDSMFANLEYVPSLSKSESKIDENTEHKLKDDAKLLQKLTEEENTNTSQLEENQATLFPGEILESENDLNFETVSNLTKLNIRTENKANEIIEEVIVPSDTVESFHLDPDHDYDLHINNPRFKFDNR